MIKGFRSKILKDLYEHGATRIAPVPGFRLNELLRMEELLMALDSATKLQDLGLPDFDLLRLGKGRFRAHWSLCVEGAKRLVFRFIDGDVYDVDYVVLPSSRKFRR
jgi:proteic killer suppression protein